MKWPGYSDKLAKVCQLHRVDDNFVTMWPRDVEKFLMLLKLLPAVASGQKTSSVGIETFNNSIDRLIVFQQVNSHNLFAHFRMNVHNSLFLNFRILQIGKSPANGMKTLNTSPYIMAYGHNISKLEYYFIVVERNMIAVCNIYIHFIITLFTTNTNAQYINILGAT